MWTCAQWFLAKIVLSNTLPIVWSLNAPYVCFWPLLVSCKIVANYPQLVQDPPCPRMFIAEFHELCGETLDPNILRPVQYIPPKRLRWSDQEASAL
jgi:hypothetical protein